MVSRKPPAPRARPATAAPRRADPAGIGPLAAAAARTLDAYFAGIKLDVAKAVGVRDVLGLRGGRVTANAAAPHSAAGKPCGPGQTAARTHCIPAAGDHKDGSQPAGTAAAAHPATDRGAEPAAPKVPAGDSRGKPFPTGDDIANGKREQIKPGVEKVTTADGRVWAVKIRNTSAAGGKAEATVSDLAAIAGVAVPRTKLGDVQGKPAVVTEWVQGTPLAAMSAGDRAAFAKKVPQADADRHTLFDYLLGHGDTHNGNFIAGTDGRLHAIDKELWGHNGGHGTGTKFDLPAHLADRHGGYDTLHKFDRAQLTHMIDAGKKMKAHLEATGAKRDAAGVGNRVAVLERFANRPDADLTAGNLKVEGGIGAKNGFFARLFGLTGNTDQPRKPAGRPDGGQFAKVGGGAGNPVAAARAEVVAAGTTSGNEHSVLLSPAGEVIARASGDHGAVDAGKHPDVSRPGAGLDLIHNHPDGSPLSPQDLKAFDTYRGVDAVTAVAHDGRVYRAVVTGDRRELSRAVDKRVGEIKGQVADRLMNHKGPVTDDFRESLVRERDALFAGIATEMAAAGFVRLEYPAGG